MSAILAFETSTMVTSVALLDGGRLVAREGGVGGAHSSDLLGMVDDVLREAGATALAIDAFAVGVGPGSFTGLRIGMATAKGLAFAAGRPLHAVSSLAALALDGAAVAPAGARIVALLDARRGEVFAGVYRAGADGLVDPVAADALVAPAALGDALAALGGGEVVLCGDGVPLVAGLGVGAALLGARATPSAASVARLAAAGRGVDGLVSGPVYLRQAEAEIKFPPGTQVPGSFAKK